MTTKFKAAIIGCGDMGGLHVHSYLASGKFEVVAIVDTNPEAMDEMDVRFGGRDDYHPERFTDANMLLQSARFDVISICAWHREHAVWTIAAATYKPSAILTEKPMAENTGRAAEMRTVCRRNGVKLAVAHQRRFLPSYVMARELISSGAIGNVELMYASAGHGLPNWSSHHADMFRFLLGDECAWVMGAVTRTTDRMERGTRIEDGASAVFQFEDGARCILTSDLTGEIYQGARIYGSNGMLDLLPEQLRILSPDTGGRWDTHSPDGRFFKRDVPQFEYVEACTGQVDELADWIDGKIEVHRGEASNGYKSLEMIMAVYESARLHRQIPLPLKTKVNPLDLMVDSDHLPVIYPGKYDIRGAKLRGQDTIYDDDDP